MNLEQLEAVCLQAAANLVAQQAQRPLPATVVLPLAAATRVLRLDGFPEDDSGRTALLERFVTDVMIPSGAPCYGFVAEAVAATSGDEPVDVVVVAYGARRHTPRVTAAPLVGDALGPFEPAEEIVPGALPFLAPLQRAADAATAEGPLGEGPPAAGTDVGGANGGGANGGGRG